MRKSLFTISIFAIGLLMSACTTELWDKVNDLDNRVESLEKAVETANQDITSIQTLVEALNGKVYVDNVVVAEDGITLKFSNGKTAVITNGKDGKNAPVISVKKDTDNRYYWTSNGEWLLDESGNRIKADAIDGKDAVAPQVRINEGNKMWEISTDGGKSWSSTGIVAEGDGSLFKDVKYQNPDYVELTLADGTVLKLPRFNENTPVFTLAGKIGNDINLKAGETRTFDLKLQNITDVFVINQSADWKVKLGEKTLSLTAPASQTEKGSLVLGATTGKGDNLLLHYNLNIVNLRVLTFEDSDYKGSSTTPDYWTSLIDTPQYGGPMLYSGTEYGWFDENNTGLSQNSVKMDWSFGEGTNWTWSCGQAISNYVETDLAKGTFNNQLAVCHKNGGHNGSKNFCIHWGYENPMMGTPAIVLNVTGEKDKVEKIVDHMYVMNTTYACNVYKNGDPGTPAAKEGDNFKIVATGYNTAKQATGTVEFLLGDGAEFIQDWTLFDLSALGKVAYIEFNMGGTQNNSWGWATPAYFAYDDVAVVFE